MVFEKQESKQKDQETKGITVTFTVPVKRFESIKRDSKEPRSWQECAGKVRSTGALMDYS